MKAFQKIILTSAIVMMGIISAFGRVYIINGPTSVGKGATVTYTLDNGALVTGANFMATNAALISNMTVTGTQYSVNITWSSTATSGVVTFANGTPSGGNDYTALATLSVTLTTCTSILTPTSIVNKIQCGGTSGSFTLSASAPATNYQIRWYAPGTNTFLAIGPVSGTSSYTTPTLSTTTSYKVTALLTTSNCESAPVMITATFYPMPATPVAYAATVLGTNTDILHANATDYGPGYSNHWYNSGGTLVNVGSTYTTSNTSPATYYVSTYDSITTCETASIPVAATLVPPIVPVTVTRFTVRVDGITQDAQLYSIPNTQADSTLIYYDGLARPVQQVSRRASPLNHDIITPYEYDGNGRTSKDYLPYVFPNSRTTANEAFDASYPTSQQSFYRTTGNKIAYDSMPYAMANYEPSPLGRVLEQGAPGKAWQTGSGHSQLANYSFNIGATSNQGEEVRKFNSDGSSTRFYAANTLSRTQVTDANGHLTITYTDGAGHTVAKKQQLDNTISGTMVNYLETYYVYNDMGQVAYILPPKAVAQLKAANWSTSQAFFDTWCFQFTYDYRDRLTQKKSPGQAAMYIAYDMLNRPVLTQTGFLRTTNQWQFVKYDVRNRPVMAGLYTDNTNTTLAQIQTLLNGLYTASNTTFPVGSFFESKGSSIQGYSNISFPQTNADGTALTVQSISYYDNYDFDNNGVKDFVYDSTQATGTTSMWRATGLATGGKSLILGTSNWLTSYAFYDKYGRTIQTRSNNQLSSAIDNLTTMVYDPNTRLVALTKTYHNAGGANQTTVVQTPSYDAKGRVTQINHSINAAPNQLVAQYQYNELGQQVAKQLHNTGGANFVQTVDLRYNIRGWLTSINNAQLASDNGVTNNDNNDFFGMELFYNTIDASTTLNNTAYYNGNISAVKWKGAGNGNTTANERSYKFSYDKSDQMLSASFQKYGTSWNQESGTLNETMTYDHNGNVLTLQRSQNQRGLLGTTVTSTPSTIDNLSYTYASGNQLSKVDDTSANTAGFNDGSSTTTEYTYDTHGNLTADANKGISAIVYNTLGKAQQITFANNGPVVTYTYDAGGNKLTMASTVGTTTTTTNYVNGFVYNTVGSTNTLNFFSSPEGRVVYKGGGSFEYQYSISDHLGNTRVVFTGATQTAQAVTATFESASQTTEASEFDNYGHISAIDNHTSGGTNSQYLNGGNGGIIGVAKSYQVYPGDQLSIQAYGSYNAPTNNSNSLAGFAAALITAFNLPTPATGEVGTPSAAMNTWGNIAAGGYGDGSNDNTDPKAFVTIVLFDKNYNFLDVAYAQLKGTSLYYMTASYTVKEAGYAYLYVSNEQTHQTDVYFDDITMSYTPGQVLQSNEYYPFGLQTAESWTRSGTTNNFLYDQGSEVNTTTGYYDTPYRNYDPALGRFFQVDPLDYKSHNFTPYHYAGNNPIGSNDPTGLLKARPPDGWWDAYDNTPQPTNNPVTPMFTADDAGVGDGALEDVQNTNDLAANTSTYSITKNVNGYDVTYTYTSDGTPISATSEGQNFTISTKAGNDGPTYTVIGEDGTITTAKPDDNVDGVKVTKRTYIIGGMDLQSEGLSTTTQSIANATGGKAYNTNMSNVGKLEDQVSNDIKAGYVEGQEVQIYGYSKGGMIAMGVANVLNSVNIPISLLITVDAANGPMSSFMNRVIPSNVAVNFNFFQTTPSSIPMYSHGDYNTGTGLIFNFNLTSPTITHGNIDEAVMNLSIFLLTH